MSLAEFLLARIAGLEAEATQQREMDERLGRQASDWGRYIIDPVIGPFGGQTQLRNVATGIYVARCSDPAWVLAECEAKRRIVELHSCDHECSEYDHNGDIDNCSWFVLDDDGCSTLRLLAMPHADHPDFEEAWRL